MKRSHGIRILLLCLVVCYLGAAHAESNCNDSSAKVPADVKAVFDKPVYKNAIWGLRIVDLETGKELIDLRPACNFYIG